MSPPSTGKQDLILRGRFGGKYKCVCTEIHVPHTDTHVFMLLLLGERSPSLIFGFVFCGAVLETWVGKECGVGLVKESSLMGEAAERGIVLHLSRLWRKGFGFCRCGKWGVRKDEGRKGP